MKLVAESGLWSLGPQVRSAPEVAVLEVAGAVLEWTVGAASAADPRITFTDVVAAEWLWRLAGPDGHAVLVTAIDAGAPSDGQVVDLGDLELAPEPVAALRHLAVGHWLRRWWPTSVRDGIAALDTALLDAEIAITTAQLQDYFSHATFDSDIAGLLVPHRAALTSMAGQGDPRLRELARAVVELAEDLGLGDWSKDDESQGVRRQDDYALAAGGPGTAADDVIARGVATVSWTAVPPAMFDAAEDTVEWSVSWSGTEALADIAVATIGPAEGIELRFQSGPIIGRGALDISGGTSLRLTANGEPVTEDQAWAHHWDATVVAVGADVTEAESARRRIRDWVRSRLSAPGPDSYLAEIVAGEADY
jgi:hypothetical protein